ncbi:MAG: hypothetical protein RLZ25_1129 [Pseudomonadota bacterium]
MIHAAKIKALAFKESRQILRDPSVFMIAFVLPVILLFLFAYAVSLDLKKVPIGLVLESQSAKAESLAAAFSSSNSFIVHPARKPKDVKDELVRGHIRGYVVIPADFDQRLTSSELQPAIQVITDGTQPNTASFVANYAQGVFAGWAEQLSHEPTTGAQLIPRYRFNPEIESHRFLIPGAIAVVMTIIGTLLTALVIAREWERGTMEAIFSTPASVTDIIIGKLIPYFFLGLGATMVATVLAITVFDVPMRGSWLALLLTTSAFLFPALGQGLLISTVSKNQFIASQIALFSGFLPAFLLSGFLYQISSMPIPLRGLTHVIPAKYFVNSLQTIFLAGDVWNVFLPDIGAMILIGLVFFLLVHKKTLKSLDA